MLSKTLLRNKTQDDKPAGRSRHGILDIRTRKENRAFKRDGEKREPQSQIGGRKQHKEPENKIRIL